MAGLKVRGSFEVTSHSLEIELDDARVIRVSADGSVHVFAGRNAFGGYVSNNYRVTLPTFEQVNDLCPRDGDGTFTVEAHHDH